MFRKVVPQEVLSEVERALEVAALELQLWSGRWAYWPEDDPSFAREIAEFPTIAICQRALVELRRARDRRALANAAEALSHARLALAAIDGEAYCADEAGAEPDERWIDVEPTLRVCDDTLLALRSEGIRATPSSSPPTGGPPGEG
jgi:hypothetical protein